MEKYKKSCKTNESEISAPIWNEEFELTEEPYFVADIQEYFEYILKKHGKRLMIIIILQ